MSLKVTVKIAVIFLLFLAACGLVKAQTFTPGVSPGDVFSYNFYAFWSSTDPEASVPADVLALNETKIIKITVHQAVGTMVIMNITKQFINGTEISSQVWVNLLSGEGDGFGLIIAPNLEKNSRAYPMGLNMSNSFVIDEEIVKTYPFGTREVLHHTENKTSVSDYRYIYHDMYFDKKTGVMLEWHVEQVSRSAPNDKIGVLWKILDFDVKESEVPSDQQSEEQPINTWTIALVAVSIIVLIAAVLIYRKKRSGRRRSG